MNRTTRANRFLFHLNYRISCFNSPKQPYEPSPRMYSPGVLRTLHPHPSLNLIEYSSRYFRALANGETPPVKERKHADAVDRTTTRRSMHCLGLEMPVATQKTDTGLTMGLLKILHRQVENLSNHVDRVECRRLRRSRQKRRCHSAKFKRSSIISIFHASSSMTSFKSGHSTVRFSGTTFSPSPSPSWLK